MEKPVTHNKLPQSDSVRELAQFWDTHDLTDFEDQLEEVTEPVFALNTKMEIHLQPEEIAIVRDMAKSRGIDSAALIQEWIHERLQAS